LAQLPLALSLVLVGVVSRQTVGALDHNSQDILKDNYLSVLAAQRMRDAADALERAALARARGRAHPSAADLDRQRGSFERELRFQEGNITEVGEREATARVRAGWAELQDALAQVLGASDAEAEAVYFARLEPTLLALRTGTNEILALNQDAMVRKSDRARKSAQHMSTLMLVVTLAAIALGFWGSLFFTDRLTRPLAVLAQAVRRLGQGDLVARARVPGKDEIAQVAGEFNTMADRLAAYRSSSLGELLQAQQASQAAIDSLSDPVLVFDLQGGLVSANQAATDQFGLDGEAEDAMAKAAVEVRDVVARMQTHVLGGKGAYVPRGLEEAVAIPGPDQARYYLARATPVQGEQAQLTGFTVVFQDVTRLRRFDELKTDMVATVAHEFRTPLTSLRMALHLCVEGAAGPLTPKQADLLYAAREDCERLQGLVGDMLDLSRIQSGKLELHRRAISSASLLSHAVDEHRAAARERSIELRVGAPTIDRPVLADPDRVRLVLINLISNALRHTPAGGQIELRAAPERDAVRFEVSDSGPGIPREYLPRLFERFFRVPGTPGGGVGLGLFIAKEIVEAHGGRIGVESDPGAGAIFWFVLPAAPAGDTTA
jgi:signal transduction histidine kinase/HAMP domain-containing protein